MNCRTCAHNRYEQARSAAKPAADMVNYCHHPALLDPRQVPEAGDIQEWMDEQDWDDEMMCDVETEPCPGWSPPEAK